MFSGAFAEKVERTKVAKKQKQNKTKKRKKERGEKKRKRCFLVSPHLEMLATKLFFVMTWEKVPTMK